MADANTTQEKRTPDIPDIRPVPIVWDIPPDPTILYSTHAVIQSTSSEFVISFFEIFPPLLMGDEDEKLRQFMNIDAIRARFLARIVMTPDRIEELIAALQENLARHKAVYGGKDIEGEDVNEPSI